MADGGGEFSFVRKGWHQQFYIKTESEEQVYVGV